MNNPEIDKMIEDILSQKEPYINNNGFTEKVMLSLPKAGVNQLWRSAIILGCTILSCLIVLFIPGSVKYITDAILDVVTPGTLIQLPISSIAIVGILLLWVIVLTKTETEQVF